MLFRVTGPIFDIIIVRVLRLITDRSLFFFFTLTFGRVQMKEKKNGKRVHNKDGNTRKRRRRRAHT